MKPVCVALLLFVSFSAAFILFGTQVWTKVKQTFKQLGVLWCCILMHYHLIFAQMIVKYLHYVLQPT